jgi:glutathione S-transferase
MPITLYAHPFSSYCQKVLTALYENATPFTLFMIDDEKAWAKLERLWPLKRMPVLVDGSRTVIEATIIIEYLMVKYPGNASLIPDDRLAALEARTMDRFFDNYIMTPMQKIVGDRLRPEDKRDPRGVEDARALLDHAYGWLDGIIADREWAAGMSFTIADCAAAPSLFYADWAHSIEDQFTNVRAYRERLLARPSFARAVDEARPFRPLFPLGAPDRD